MYGIKNNNGGKNWKIIIVKALFPRPPPSMAGGGLVVGVKKQHITGLYMLRRQ
jgi:hypothetical protein